MIVPSGNWFWEQRNHYKSYRVKSETQEIPVIPVGIKIAMQHAAENAMDLGEKKSVLLIKLCPIYKILIVFIANSKIRIVCISQGYQ